MGYSPSAAPAVGVATVPSARTAANLATRRSSRSTVSSKAAHGNELAHRVGVVAAGGDVGAGQAAEGQLRAVGAAAGRDEHGLDAHLAVGLHGIVNEQLVSGTELLGHVAVLLAHLDGDRALAVAGVLEGGDAAQRGLALVEVGGVKVAQDVAELDLVRGAGDVRGVVVALAALGVLRALGGRDHLLELGGQSDGVDHNVLGAAGVDHHALEGDRGLARAEALVVELAQGLAVHGVAPLGAQRVEVQELRAVADLLVGDKRHLDGGMGQLGVGDQTRQERADLCHAGLVVSRRRSVEPSEHTMSWPWNLAKVRHLIRRGLDGLVVDDAGHQRATLVVDDVGLDAGGRGVLGSVEVGAEHERGGVLGALGGGRSCRSRRHAHQPSHQCSQWNAALLPWPRPSCAEWA